jgi:hypothetical protein
VQTRATQDILVASALRRSSDSGRLWLLATSTRGCSVSSLVMDGACDERVSTLLGSVTVASCLFKASMDSSAAEATMVAKHLVAAEPLRFDSY